MRFNVISTLLTVLALGHASVQANEPDYTVLDRKCYHDFVHPANLDDCQMLLNDPATWDRESTAAFQEEATSVSEGSKVACYQECCIYHRYEDNPYTGISISGVRIEALKMLDCAGPGDKQITARASFNPDPEEIVNMRHKVCIAAGHAEDITSCFQGDGWWLPR